MKKTVIIACIILAAVFIVGIATWLCHAYLPADDPQAEIYSGGVLVRSVDLSQDAVFTIEYNGGCNTIEVSHGSIKVVKASCPDEVCIHTGAISGGAIPIICLPNRLEIKIVSAAKSEADAVIG